MAVWSLGSKTEQMKFLKVKNSISQFSPSFFFFLQSPARCPKKKRKIFAHPSPGTWYQSVEGAVALHLAAVARTQWSPHLADDWEVRGLHVAVEAGAVVGLRNHSEPWNENFFCVSGLPPRQGSAARGTGAQGCCWLRRRARPHNGRNGLMAYLEDCELGAIKQRLATV